MSDLDTLRWGDVQALVFIPSSATAGLVGPTQTKQLLHAHWKRPLTWKVLVSIEPQIPATELGTFNAAAQFALGCGGGFVTINRLYTFTNAGGYAPILDIFDLPAQDIQGLILLNGITPATQDVIQEVWNVAIMAAPITEPDGYTEVARMLRELAANLPPRQPMDQDPANAELPRWMPPGFDDGELRYR